MDDTAIRIRAIELAISKDRLGKGSTEIVKEATDFYNFIAAKHSTLKRGII